jgi:hypothetical protein
MPSAPVYNNNTNPNAKGGAFSYDGRTGLGIGSLTKGPASGLGSNWNMGDALSSPKSQWDKEIEEDDKEIDELEVDIESKAHLSFHRGATDSLSRRGTSIGYMGGIGSDMSAVIGLSAGHSLEGQLVSENLLKSLIKEVILCEYTISGNLASRSRPKAKGTGGKRNRTVYSVDKTTSHTNKLDNSSTQKSRGIDHNGYGQRAQTPDMWPYVKKGKPTTDGGETLGAEKVKMRQKRDQKSFDSGKSTYEVLTNSIEQECEDEFNVLFRNYLNK